MPDDKGDVELDAEAKALQLEQVKAETRKAIAEANAATQAAGLYQPQSKPVAGTTDLGDNGAKTVLDFAAVRALDGVAKTIATHVKKVATGGILLVESRALAQTDAPRVEIRTRFDWFAERIRRAKEALDAVPTVAEPAGTVHVEVLPALVAAAQAGGTVMSVVGLAADLYGMFKTNYSVAHQDLAFDFGTAAAAVASHLADEQTPVVVDGFETLEGSSTLGQFEQLLGARSDLELQALAVDPGNAAAQPVVAGAKAVIAAFDAYVAAITTVPDGEKYPPLVAAAMRDLLHDDQGRPAPVQHVLYLNVVAAGGEATTKTGLFTRNSKVGLVGGVHLTYLLADRNGSIRAAGSNADTASGTFDVGRGTLTWGVGA